MTTKFFDSPKNQIKVSTIRSYIESIAHEQKDKELAMHLNLLLKSFLSEPTEWDKYSPMNINRIGDTLLLTESINGNISVDLHILFALCFRFFIERSITEPGGFTEDFENIRSYTIENIDNFPSNAKKHIKYALLAMPTDIVQYRVGSKELEMMNTFIISYRTSEETRQIWKDEIDERQLKVDALKQALDNHHEAFNFVGLHDGFKRLGENKTKELKSATWLMGVLACLALVPIIAELVFILIKGDTLNISHALVSAVPATSLLLILIYYFRVALQDYKSIKSQINQIELRKSLCMFIQNYVEYSKTMKSGGNNTLDKFENVIFSNILMSDEKLPSTFDGLDSIASIIKEIKIKS
ncbi:TPA: hypothetical protein ACKPZB_005070 [Serratia marcescens]